MPPVPLSRGAYSRAYGREPSIKCLNRFFEENPSNQVDGVALLSRPATKTLLTVGDGPIRAMYTLNGIFDDALFVVSGTALYQVTTGLGVIPITGTIAGGGAPRMVGRADSDGDRLFICDGTNLYYYGGNAVQSVGVFTLLGNLSGGETVTIGDETYTFVTALDSAGGSPFEVVVGASAADTVANFITAINGGAGEGIVYGEGTTASSFVTAVAASGDAATVTAITAGSAGNSIATTDTVGSATGGWGGATLSGGANGSLTTISTPDSVGIVSIDILAQHVVCVVSNSQRFYWILPGEETIDPLNFAEAEQQPDELISCRTQGDVIWLFGEASSEVWYADPNATDAAARFVRQQGQAFSRGIVEGTDTLIDDTLIVVGDDNRVYVIRGGMVAVDTPYISEVIRRAERIRRESA